MSGTSTRVATVIMAAGRSSRFGGAAQGSKVVAELRGVSLVRTVVSAALASKTMSVIVVSGHDHASVAATLDGLADIRIVHNAQFASGMASSLETGIAALPIGIDGVLVMLADMPLVRTSTLDQLIARFAELGAARDAVVPTFRGTRGNPVLIAARLFPALMRLHGDEGARRLLGRPDLAIELCEVDDPGIIVDVDTPEALSALDRDAP